MTALDMLRPSYCGRLPGPVCTRAPVGYSSRTCCFHVRQVPSGRELLSLARIPARRLLLHLEGLGSIVGLLRHGEVLVVVLHLISEALRHAIER